MRGIGEGADPGDFSAQCAYCNGWFLRSELHRDEAGLLKCEGHDGREPIELDRANAEAAKETLIRGTGEGSNYPSFIDPDDITETLEEKLATLGTPG
jgi:hypothetical protein